MTARQRTLQALSRLVTLRERVVDRLSADLAARHALRRRHLGTLERLDGLFEGSGATGELPPAQSLNCGAYKQALLVVTQTQREDLVLHDAQIAQAQAALHEATRRHESLGQAVATRQRQHARVEAGREHKQQDDVATQVWQRGRE